MGWLRKFVDRVGGKELPEGSPVVLAEDEHVVAVAERLVATSLGLWLPDADGGAHRIGWHLISKAAWANGVLTVTEARQLDTVRGAVLLEDLPPRRYELRKPGRLPEVVHQRVTGSIRSSHRRELPGGGAWLVQRKVPGQDGIVLQVRADPGTDEQAVRTLAANVATEIGRVRDG